MEISVQKCESSDFPKKSRFVDLKSVYAEKPRGLDRKCSVQKASKGLKRENSSPFEIIRSPTNGARRKRSRKEASLSSFGPAIIKKRRNGLNSLRLKPNRFSSGVGKPEKLSNSSGFSDGLQNFVSDSALDNLKKNNSGTLSIGNSSSGLCDGVVIPKKPRGGFRQRKVEKGDSRKTVKDGYDRIGKSCSEPLLNELPSGVAVASPSRVSDGQTKKKSTVVDEQPTDVTSLSQVSDGQRKKKSTEDKDEQSTDVASHSHVSDGQRKKKSTDAKDEHSTDVASHSRVSDGKGKKKSTDAKDEHSTDVASHSRVSDGKGKKKCTDGKNESSTDVGSPSQVADDKGMEKSIDVNNESSIDVVSASHVSDGKRKKKSTDVNKNELFTDVASSSQVLDGKRKKKSNKVKENGFARVSSIARIKADKRVRHSKKNSTTMAREDHLENGTPLADDGEEFYGDFREDDLEQNAARMLSSRFDPSCTGFSGSRVSALSKLKNRGNFKALQPESSPVDAAGRMLRPRRRNGKSFVRKRRHFYEVSSRDMDPYCILKQRIRVFWPLDQSWYFGLVKDYDPVTRLHHVKYDDRDEEWINLQNERFKLLLFPSEISGTLSSGKSRLELKQEEKKVDKTALDDSSGNCTESEPIIAWLIRSKNHRKLSTYNMIKKKRTHLLKDFEPSISLELQGHSGADPSNLFPKLEETLQEVTSVRSNTIFNDRELSFVYFRRKFHKRREGLEKTLAQDSLHGSSAASINILASVADSAAVLEELYFFGPSVEQKQVTLRLSFQQLHIHNLSFGMEGSLCHALLLIQFGILTNVWPTVRMEIVIVDNVLGLRLLLFEGSLRCAVVLLCLIIRSFSQHSKGGKFEEMQMPFTSVGINLSGLCDQCGKLLFSLYRFLEMKRSKWRYVEDKLQQQCVTMQEIPLLDFTPSTFNNLRNGSGQMLCTSMYKNAASLENFQERSYLEIIRQITPVNPAVCYIDENCGRLPPCSLSVANTPSFSLSLHIKSLIDKNRTSVSFEKRNSCSSRESPDSHDKLTVNGCSPFEDPSDQVSDITVENMGSSLGQVAASSGKLHVGHLKVEADAIYVSSDGDRMRSSHNSLRNEVNISGNSVGRQDMELNGSDETVVRIERFPSCTESSQDAEKSSSSFPEGYSSPEKSEGGYGSYMNNANSQVGQIEQSIDKGTLPAEPALGLTWEMNGYSIHSLNPTAPRSVRHCNGNSSVSPKYGHYSKSWTEDLMRNGFISGSKKPRTQVSYSLPFGGFDLGSKRRSHHRKPWSYKKIKADDAKRLLGVSANSQSYHGPLTCNANVLVTVGDKGWRECGAQVVIESDDQKDWRICAKFSGVTKYAYKAQHILQPGITNRHTHAMMWKGGKNWTLEFIDRSQWSLFKEIHEECFNRNIRAAYVKNIPIPGVRLIADDDNDDIVGVPFVRSSSKYYRQFGTEGEMALDSSRVLYDMDSDDEEWVSEMRNSVDMRGGGISELTDDMFERVMDIFEKFAYAQQCDEFSSDEIEEFMADVVPLAIVKTIYEYWRQKRLKKGMALIRQFQPALWVRYQQQLKEWESAMSRMNYLPDGSREKACPIKKPPMFAFCLKPRGLEAPNKLLKQRSHKKFISTGSLSAFAREQDGFHSCGRRTNGLGDERALVVSIPSYESSDSYHSNDGSERFQSPELPRNAKKRWTFSSPRDPQMMPFSQNKRLKKNGMDSWSPRIHEPSSMNQIQRDGLRRHRADIDQFKLRDASGAAKHALSMARMKREKAQWLIHRADLALHKATVALMIAEAMKESKEEDKLADDEESEDDI